MNRCKFTIPVCLVLVMISAGCNMSKFVVAPPFTDVEKIGKVEIGKSYDEVNQSLGIKPYDVLYLNDGNQLYYYNYRLLERKINVTNSRIKAVKGTNDNLSSQVAQTFGEPFYTEWRRLYVNFIDGKVANFTTDSGLKNANYIALVNGSIKLLSSTDLKLNHFFTPNQNMIFGENGNIIRNEDTQNGNLDIDKILFPLKYNGSFEPNKSNKIFKRNK
jgi:hypothetical protein